jgi:hypothetical protein
LIALILFLLRLFIGGPSAAQLAATHNGLDAVLCRCVQCGPMEARRPNEIVKWNPPHRFVDLQLR